MDKLVSKGVGRTEIEKRLLADKCELCGSQEKVEVHHIRALKDLEKQGKEKPAWVKIMAMRRRKTLAVCQSCHNNIHQGQGHGQSNTGEPDAVKVARPVRRGTNGKVPEQQLASSLPYPVDRNPTPVPDTRNRHSNGTMPAVRYGAVPAASNGAIQPHEPVPAAAPDGEAIATEEQLNSIRKLCERLGKAAPENVSELNYLTARKVIRELTAEYRELKQQNSKAS